MRPSDPEPGGRRLAASLRALAESAARVGGQVAHRFFGRPGTVGLKADRSEVSSIDRSAERAIVAHIRRHRPHDWFLTEEGTVRPRRRPTVCGAGDQPLCWVIDPLDGTRNYVRDVPVFTCCVAAMRGGFPIVGAIYDPIGDVMYSADAMGGTRVNGVPLTRRQADRRRARRKTAKLIVGIPSARHRHGRALVRVVFARHVVRNFGSTALHLALVATGRFDAALTSNSRLWDLAAGWLIVTQAGGVMTLLNGRPLFPLELSRYRGGQLPCLAGSPAAHAALLAQAGRLPPDAATIHR